MATISLFRFVISVCSLIFIIHSNDAKPNAEKFYMDKMCGNDPLILDGDNRPGISFQLTSNNKYKANFNCTVRFRTAQPSQRFIITIEKMDIADCPGDLLRIYDGTTLMNRDAAQQCGSPVSFSLVSSTAQISMIFTSNSATESSGFQSAIALNFPMVATCPQNLGFFQCKNKNCISKKLECDGRNHCGDGTDENQCSIIG